MEKVKIKDTKTGRITDVNKSVWDNIKKSPVLSLRYQLIAYLSTTEKTPENLTGEIKIVENKIETQKGILNEKPKIIKVVDRTTASNEAAANSEQGKQSNENTGSDKTKESDGNKTSDKVFDGKIKKEVAEKSGKSGKLLTKKNK